MSERDNELDPSSILRSIEDDERRAKEAFTPNVTLLYAVWGLAWIVGFLAIYAAHIPDGDPLLPTAAGLVIGAAALIAAIAFSATHSAQRSAGSRGPSMVQGAIYGNMFPVSFMILALLGWRLSSSGVQAGAMLSYWVAATCLVIGLLFVTAAIIWNDRSQLITGAWIVIAGLVSVTLPPPHTLLAGIAGGIGFLIIAVIQIRLPHLTSGQIWRDADE